MLRLDRRVRQSLDETSYVIRFTPRRKGSVWSSVNLARAQELTRLGLMRPAGLVAHEARTPAKSGLYSYEQRKPAALPEALKRRLKGNRKAWAFFKQQPAWYRQGRRVVDRQRQEAGDAGAAAGGADRGLGGGADDQAAHPAGLGSP